MTHYIVLFVLAFQLAAHSYAADYTIVPDEAKTAILTPSLAERKTLKIKLSNGLEAYLISDPKTDKSGAVLSVFAGSWEDPEEHPGIAHFLEHMLFLGTAKYPEESSYQKYISENGGMTNAFTSMMQTSFMFSVNNDAFDEALDRFSEFFKHPLFNPSGVARELHAIDQEYATHLDNDDMRTLMIDKELANPKHPYHNFSIGNSETLSNVSQETLKKWYQDHYSANIMRLVVYSAEPMDQLRDRVVNYFKDIPNHNISLKSPEEPLYLYPEIPQVVYIDSVKNSRTLSLVWELPKKFAQMIDERPQHLICHILGHEGSNSLLATLKRQHYADKLQCTSYRMTADSVAMYLDVELTDEGLAHVNDVILEIFQTLALIKNEPLSEYLFDDVHRMNVLNYQYQPREDVFQYMMKNASWSNEEPLSSYPEKSIILQKFDPQAIQEMAQFLSPHHAKIYISAPAAATKVAPTQKEKWMGTGYAIRKVNEEVANQWENAGGKSEIGLPSKNQFIPQHLKQRPLGPLPNQLIPHPEILRNDRMSLAYFAKDERYQVPQVAWLFEIKTPNVEMGSAIKTVLADLYVKAVNEALNTISYPAQLAGLTYDIQRKDYGIAFKIYGYNENAELLLDKILEQLKNVKPSELELELYQQTLRRDYQNFSKKSPIEQASEYLKSILFKKYVTEKQKSLAINRVTYEKFNEYVKNLYAQFYLQGMLYGDLEQEQAKRIIDKVVAKLDGAAYLKGATIRPEVIMIPENQGPFYWEVTSKAQGNGVVLAIEHAKFSFKERAGQEVMMQAIDLPFFATLRTKQQTGYAVFSTDRELELQLFDLFAVQSSTHAVRDLLARFELFLETFIQEMPTELPEERFKTIRDGLVNELQQPPKSVKEMAEVLQLFAFDHNGDFDWLSKRINGLKELSYGEFVDIVKNSLGRSNKRRAAILLKGTISEDKSFIYSPMGSLQRLKKTSLYSGDQSNAD